MTKIKIVFILVVSLISQIGYTLMNQQYSAEQVLTSEGKTVTQKIYVDQGKARVEMAAKGMNLITLVDYQRKAVYQLMPGNRYIEMPLQGVGDPLMSMPQGDSVLKDKIGTETIQGQLCDKYKVIQDQYQAYMWINQANQMPVRMEGINKPIVVEWKNIVAGPQDPSLFRIPSGYQKIELPQGMPPMKH